MKKVSIITPAYNDSKYIRMTLDSVLRQAYENWELLVIDDHSTDNTVEIVKSYGDSRIRLFQNESNQGTAYSRNVGLRNATGDYVAFLDADDWWAEDKLEKQIRFMEEGGIAFSCTAYYRVNQNGGWRLVSAPSLIDRKTMLRCDYVGCLTAMYDRRVIGLVQVDPRILKRNDYAIWLEASKKADCHYLPEPLAFYRVRQGSISRVSGFKLLSYHQKLFRLQLHLPWIYSWFCALRNGFNVLRKRKKYVSDAPAEPNNE